jgi:hydrogenase nickel incorporation protein HypA/HybF
MHELPITKSILEIVLRHTGGKGVTRVMAVDLSIGALSDLEAEWLQTYFDRLARGTVAEGAKLRVQRSPLTFRCIPCSTEYTSTREDLDNTRCPECGSGDGSIVGGTGYTVESMEVE